VTSNTTFKSNGSDIKFRKLTSDHNRYNRWNPPVSLLAAANPNAIDGGNIDGEIDLYNVMLSGKGGALTGSIRLLGLVSPNGREAAESIYTNVTPHHGFTFNGYPISGKLLENSTSTVADTKPMTVPPRIPTNQVVLDSSRNPVLYRAMNEAFPLSSSKNNSESQLSSDSAAGSAKQNIDESVKKVVFNKYTKSKRLGQQFAIVIEEANPSGLRGERSDSREKRSRIKWVHPLEIAESTDKISNALHIGGNKDTFRLRVGTEDISSNKVIDAVRALNEKIGTIPKDPKEGGPKNSLIVYFSGHGIAHNGESYWLTKSLATHSEPVVDLVNSAISSEKIKSEISKLIKDGNIQDVIVISESCKPSGLLKNNPDNTKEEFQFRDVPLDKSQDNLSAKVVFSASQYFAPAYQGKFSSAFIEELKKITPGENFFRIYQRMRASISNDTLIFEDDKFDQQEPDYRPMIDSNPDGKMGFFIFPGT